MSIEGDIGRVRGWEDGRYDMPTEEAELLDLLVRFADHIEKVESDLRDVARRGLG